MRMNKYGLSQRKISMLKNFFENRPEIERVYIYGSRVKGNFKDSSDIDLAVRFKNNENGNLAKLKADIEELPILNEISLVDEEKIEEGEFKKEYQKTKELFFSRK